MHALINWTKEQCHSLIPQVFCSLCMSLVMMKLEQFYESTCIYHSAELQVHLFNAQVMHCLIVFTDSLYISLPPSLLSSLTEVYTLMSTRWLRVITRVHVYIQYIQQKALHWKACTNHGGSLTLGIYKCGLLTSRLLKSIHNRHPGIMSYTKQKYKRGINAFPFLS